VATAICVPGATPRYWIDTADKQLYFAKNAGRDSVRGTTFDVMEMMRATRAEEV
jgi:hypothetical protein